MAATPPPPGQIEPAVEALIKAIGIDFRIGGKGVTWFPPIPALRQEVHGPYHERGYTLSRSNSLASIRLASMPANGRDSMSGNIHDCIHMPNRLCGT